MACTGWTWEQVVWETDLPQLQAMYRYWAAHPPLHMMVAAYLGIKDATVAPQDPDAALADAAQHMPVNSLSATEFDDLLRQQGLTT